VGSDLLSSRDHLLMFQLDAAGGSYRATDHVSSGGEGGKETCCAAAHLAAAWLKPSHMSWQRRRMRKEGGTASQCGRTHAAAADGFQTG
jgi:hypothetical protein